MIRFILSLCVMFCLNLLFSERISQKDIIKIGSKFRIQMIEVNAGSLVINCPVNATEAACQTQAAIDAKFASWVSSATFSGGCNPLLTNNNTGAPSACGGSVTVTFTVTSSCDPAVSCSAVFAVINPPPVILNVAGNVIEASCKTQAAINSAFANWLATTTFTGGCNSVMSNNNDGSPPACGGTKTIKFIVTSTCEAPVTASAKFTVTPSPPVIVSCPTNITEAAGQSQSSIDGKYATWLNSASFSGGCNANLSNNSTGTPDHSGGSVTVIFTVTSSCEPNKTCRSTFTVKPPVFSLKCPSNVTELACQTQAEINTKFNTWLNSVTFEGGCNVVVTNNNTGSPPACGGSTSVKFTATSSCDPTVTCSASFAVVPSPSVVLLCPANKTEAPCQSQAAIDSKFAAWLASASYLGGCHAALSNDNLGAPSACGGSANVRFVVTTACEPPKTCISVFTVQSSPPVVLTCPANQVEDTGQTQSQINIKFAKWLNDYNFSGGCNAVISNNSTDAPSSKGGSRTVLFSIASGCEPNKTCKAKFSVNSGLVSTGGFNNPVDSTAGLNFLNNRYNSDIRKFAKQFEIEPNPVKGNGIVKIELFEKQFYRIDLINVLGKTIWSTVDSKIQNQFEIEFSDYPAGLYFLVLSTDHSNKVLKWIVN